METNGAALGDASRPSAVEDATRQLSASIQNKRKQLIDISTLLTSQVIILLLLLLLLLLKYLFLYMH